MARLPKPGGDAGNWGEILNDFLRQEHHEDGSLKGVARPADVATKADKSTTDALVQRLDIAHNDDGTLKNEAVEATQVATDLQDFQQRADPGEDFDVGDLLVGTTSGVPRLAASRAIVFASSYSTLTDALTAGSASTVVIAESQTVPVGTVVPANTRVLVPPGVVLTREQPSTGDWITLGPGAIWDGGEFDGNKGNATGFSRLYEAISVQAGGEIRNAYVHDNNGHGIRLYAGARAINCRSDANGDNPGPSGTGDGIYSADVTGVVIEHCTTTGNARIGVTSTSNSGDTGATLRDVVSMNNGYLRLRF